MTSDYRLSEIRVSDRFRMNELDELLARNGIRRDANLDYIVGMYDADDCLVASGAAYADTLRCLAVDEAHQGAGLLNRVVSHLVDYRMARGNARIFLYTKCDKAKFFGDLGFYEIARVEGVLSFMENRRDGFSSYLRGLVADETDKTNKTSAPTGALVMNCNPFTLGHRYLVETASRACGRVHLFIVSEDASFFPFRDRYELVRAGTADLPNVFLHPTDSYMISSAVFPSYFLEDDDAAIRAQTSLDLAIFGKIARLLGITRRYVGEEPFSRVTGIYNEAMTRLLPQIGVACIVIPRREVAGAPISASRVRQLIHDDRMDEVCGMVPQTVFDYFFTPQGQAAVARIRGSGAVVHY